MDNNLTNETLNALANAQLPTMRAPDVFNPIPDTKITYKELPFTLQANESLQVNIQFQLVKAILTSSDTAIIARIGYSTDIVRIAVGLGYSVTSREMEEGKFYPNITLQNTTASPQTCTLIFAFGTVTDDRITIGGSVVSRLQNAATFNTGQISIGSTAVQIDPANVNRKALTIFAGDSDLWVGQSNAVTTANGHRVLAGSSITFTHNDVVFGIRTGAAQNCTFAEETY